jgi:hypothetical protein
VFKTVRKSLCLSALLAAVPAFSQITADARIAKPEAAAAAPVAHVYVATPKGVELYDAASNGKLTVVSGSPFAGNFIDMVTDGPYFYATDGNLIYEETVAASGALKRIATINPAAHTPGSEGVTALDMDHTGAYVYANVYNDGTYYQSYKINKTNGDLVWLGNGNNYGNPQGAGPIRILGNNKFAFQPQAYITYYLGGLTIGSNGELSGPGNENAFPVAEGDNLYNAYTLATDTTDNVAAAVYQLENPPDGPVVGPTQIAIYTSNGAGNLSTKSTYENMPATAIGTVSMMNASPSGKLLAVAGSGPGQAGLQIFHFNGSSQVTKYTGLLTSTPIDEVHWDNDNHLYAISHSAGKLFVFTATPTSVSEAAGSPYTVASPQSIIIRPL